jgi:hypothetical protein
MSEENIKIAKLDKQVHFDQLRLKFRFCTMLFSQGSGPTLEQMKMEISSQTARDSPGVHHVRMKLTTRAGLIGDFGNLVCKSIVLANQPRAQGTASVPIERSCRVLPRSDSFLLRILYNATLAFA